MPVTSDWSYDLLSEAEKALFCRVSVFSGGWTVEAARQVCGLERLAEGEVLELVASLTGKSLVVAEERNGANRYRMLRRCAIARPRAAIRGPFLRLYYHCPKRGC